MKKIWILTLPVLFLLTCCSGVIPGGNRDLTYEQVQLYAQQTLTAQAGVPADSFDPGALLIRPAATEAPASSGLTIISTPETDDVITRPVYNIPTAAPTAIPTATPLILQNPQYQQPEPVYSTPNYAQQVNTVCDRLRFIDDITIPDDTVMAPGQIFRKTWRIQNAGSCTWTAGYQLVYFSGDSLGETYAVNLPRAVAPGDTIDVSVDFTAPRRYGTFQSNWKLRSPSGNVFGTANTNNDAEGGIWVKIVVANNVNMSTVAPGVTPVNTGCMLLSVKPEHRASFKPGEETDFEFRVRNTSGQMWNMEDMDIAYVGGENMLKRKENSRLDLPMDVAPNGTLYYALDAVVPTTPGVYTMTMGVVRGYEVLCSMDVTISVVW